MTPTPQAPAFTSSQPRRKRRSTRAERAQARLSFERTAMQKAIADHFQVLLHENSSSDDADAGGETQGWTTIGPLQVDALVEKITTTKPWATLGATASRPMA